MAPREADESPKQSHMLSEKSRIYSKVKEEKNKNEQNNENKAGNVNDPSNNQTGLDSRDLDANLSIMDTIDIDTKLVILNDVIMGYLDELDWRPESPDSISNEGTNESTKNHENALVDLLYPDLNSDPFNLNKIVEENFNLKPKKPLSDSNHARNHSNMNQNSSRRWRQRRRRRRRQYNTAAYVDKENTPQQSSFSSFSSFAQPNKRYQRWLKCNRQPLGQANFNHSSNQSVNQNFNDNYNQNYNHMQNQKEYQEFTNDSDLREQLRRVSHNPTFFSGISNIYNSSDPNLTPILSSHILNFNTPSEPKIPLKARTDFF